MPTLRTIIDGRDLTLGDMMPRVKAAAKPIVNPADDEEDDDSSDDTATHIAKHIQDPVGSTKQMFQDLTEKKLAFDMQKAIAKQGLAPVKAIIDHVEQTYELNGPNLITGNPGMNPDQQGGFTPNGPGAPQINRPNNGGQMNNMQPGEDDARPNNQTQPPAAKARTQMRSPMPKTRSEDEKQVPPRQVNVNKGKRNTRGGFSVHIKSSTAPLPRGIQQMQSAVALQAGGPGSGRHKEGGGNYAPTGKGTVHNAIKNLHPDGHRAINYNPEYAKSMAQHSAAAKYHSDAAAFYHDIRPGLANKHADAATAHRAAAVSFGKGGDFKSASQRARVASYNAHNAEETYQENNLPRKVRGSAIEAGGKGSGRYKTTYSGSRHVGGRVRKHEQRRVEENEKGLRAGGPGSGRRPGIGTNAKTYAEHKSASENHLYRARTLDEQGEKDAANAHYRASDAHHDAAKSVDTEGDVDKTSSRNARKLSNKAYIADQERFISLGGKDK